MPSSIDDKNYIPPTFPGMKLPERKQLGKEIEKKIGELRLKGLVEPEGKREVGVEALDPNKIPPGSTDEKVGHIKPGEGGNAPAPSSDKKAIGPSPLEKMKEQHKIEKHKGTGPLSYVIRATSLIGMGIIALLGGIFMLAYKVGAEAREKYWPDPVITSIRDMKIKEETGKFQTMQNVLKNLNIDSKKDPKVASQKLTTDIKTILADPAKVKEIQGKKATRLLLRELARKGVLTPEWVAFLKDKNLDQEKLAEFYDNVKGSPLKDTFQADLKKINWDKLFQKARKETMGAEGDAAYFNDRDVVSKRNQDIQEFENSITELLTILNTRGEDFRAHPAAVNQKFIAELRKALRSPVYQTMKEDLSNPAVHLLQRFASDMWNKAPSMDAYRGVGDSLVDTMGIKLEDGKKLTGKKIADLLDQSQKKMSKMHWTDHGGLFGFGGKLAYGITHPRQMLGSMASEGGLPREIAATFGLDVYDSHGTLSNNPSLQGTTTLKMTQKGAIHDAKIRNCYGGSPTIGDHEISPEFLAILQAAENNQFLPIGKRDEEIPLMVNYNNLQNLDKKHGEGPRSRTIMLLNDKFPLSFRGATYAKDSALHEMKKDGDVRWEVGQGPEAFGKIMMGEIERSFIPGESGHGFYFHGSYDEWKPIFDAVIADANKHFATLDKPKDLNDCRKLQGAYQEYVYSMLIGSTEMQSLQILIDRGIPNPSLTDISACKENIDRGGMENTKYIYNRLPDEFAAKLTKTMGDLKIQLTDQELAMINGEENIQLNRDEENRVNQIIKAMRGPDNTEAEKLGVIMGAMHSRALSARDRVILYKRMLQILDYMRTTTPGQFREHMDSLFQTLGYGVSDQKFEVALGLKPIAPIE